jgi:hypothetical protein
MNSTDPYEIISERMGFPGSARMRAVLESLMDSELALLATALPGTPAEVAEKTGVTEDEAREGLETLFTRGVAFAATSCSSTTQLRRPRR